MNTASFDKISPTALNLVWLRSQSGIAYCAQIATITRAKERAATGPLGPEGTSPDVFKRLAGWAELRYRALDSVIENHLDIFEIAAGFSPRGLIQTKARPEIRYLATDLPGVFDERISVNGLFGIPPNLYLASADASKREELFDCYDEFFGKSSRFAVHFEGLLGYLDRAQKLDVAKNIRVLLEHANGGICYTPDIHTEEEMERMLRFSQVNMERYDEMTGRTFMKGCFKSLDDAQALFEEAGLKVQRADQVDYVPIEKLVAKSNDTEVVRIHKEQHLWSLSLR